MRPSTTLIAGLAALLLVNALISMTLYVAADGGAETVWVHVGRLLHGSQDADSWKPMEVARAYALAPHTRIYEKVFFGRIVKFQYPPSALLFVGSLTRPALNVISWFATLASVALTAVIFRLSLKRHWSTHAPANPGDELALIAVVACLGFSFYPVVKAYSLGQIQAWLNALFAVVLLAWMTGRPMISGVALAVMCLIKPTYAPLLLWALVRRQWTMLSTALAAIGIGLGVSVARYGLADHVDYLAVLSFIGRRGEAFYANQSFNGALNRMIFNGANLVWQRIDFPQVNPVVFAVTVGFMVVLLSAGLLLPVREAGRAGPVDLCIMVLTATMTAPIAWEHHYGVMLPMYAAVLPLSFSTRALGRWTAPALVMSYVCASNFFQFTSHFAETWLNALQSYLLVGALMLLSLMYATVRRSA